MRRSRRQTARSVFSSRTVMTPHEVTRAARVHKRTQRVYKSSPLRLWVAAVSVPLSTPATVAF